ncbi:MULTISPECIES: sulfite exporter TauE/SafE family protein [Mesoflavibacter]|uniref:Probable membrane transporter protein n=1 Tax=Mesoflavibacter profundi TaxID=2708110 RepID=A0ABT4RX00_9FLAO|nr:MULTISPECIES: sulfite exporter TauE/SafE family protein [Mesoflavibacter]MDA0176351.1 sulfite exporter TauE/SafE family protein [Mesoflavibacter profundi]QIJ89991.1 hypothetical protein C7H62_2183 [Mesoflavibacter sp. HG96]QIJ92719.1 hypothetical protein C7H56_2183 [Mesoflavibacter sp. HG37]
MQIEYFLGYIGALFIGLILGLIGGGGSILTVPILVYLIGINPVTATAYSLFVVGTSAFVGTLKNIQKKLVDFKIATVFVIPAFVAVYLTRKYLIPAIPNQFYKLNSIIITKDIAIMMLFAILMLMASLAMIKTKTGVVKSKQQINYIVFFFQAAFIGVLTGLVGAGGGFLIIPTLMFFARISIKKAVATSLLIIAINSLIGFIGDVQNIAVDWIFLLTFTIISVIGIFIGIYLSKFINNRLLKKGFGWFVLVMGIFIITKELMSI